MVTKEQFEFIKEHGITEDQFFGREKITGGLNLVDKAPVIPDGFKPDIEEYLWANPNKIPDNFSPTVGGNLSLRKITSLSKGFSPTVGGDLILTDVTSLPKDFSLTVGRDLELNYLVSLPDGFSPIVGRHLELNRVDSISSKSLYNDGFNPTVGGNLELRRLTSLADDFSLTVGGDLSLGYLNKLPKNFSPNVGGSLGLNYLTSLPDDFSLTVGGSLSLPALTSLPNNLTLNVGKDLYLTSISNIKSISDLKKNPKMKGIKVKGYIYFKKFNTKNPDAKELTFEDVVEDVCQPDENVILYRMEDFMAYGIVSGEDAKRFYLVAKDLHDYCTNSKEYEVYQEAHPGWFGLLNLYRFSIYEEGTCMFILDPIGGEDASLDKNEAKDQFEEFVDITKSDGENFDGEGSDVRAYTLSRDYITTWRSNIGVEGKVDIDTVIGYIEEAKFDLIESFRDFGFPDCNIKGIKPVRLLNVMYKRNFNSGILQDFDKSEYYK